MDRNWRKGEEIRGKQWEEFEKKERESVRESVREMEMKKTKCERNGERDKEKKV